MVDILHCWSNFTLSHRMGKGRGEGPLAEK